MKIIKEPMSVLSTLKVTESNGTKKLKMFITILLTVIICVSAAAVSAAAESSYIRGDADGDGRVTIIDVTKIQRVISRLETDSNGAVKRRGNVTGGLFDINDATAVQRYIAKYDDSYGIGKIVRYDEYELPFIPN